MKLSVDKDADALTLQLADTNEILESEEIAPGVIVDFDSAGRVVGIELLNVSKQMVAIDMPGVAHRLDADQLQVSQLEPSRGG